MNSPTSLPGATCSPDTKSPAGGPNSQNPPSSPTVCQHNRAYDDARAEAATHRWRVLYECNVAAAEAAYEQATEDAMAACNCPPSTTNCKHRKIPLALALTDYGKAMRSAKQKVWRCRNMWMRRYPACDACAYVPLIPASPFKVRKHRIRTAAEVLAGKPGTGQAIGAGAREEFPSAL